MSGRDYCKGLTILKIERDIYNFLAGSNDNEDSVAVKDYYMPLSIMRMGRYVTCIILALAFSAPAAKSALSAERAPTIYAYYCPAKEIAFIGELMPPVISIIEDAKVRAELDLSNAQLGKMKEADNAFFAGLKDVLAGNEAGGSTVDHAMAIGKLSEDVRKRTNEILKPHQLSRMQELLLQLYGIFFVPRKDLRQLLRLDVKQEWAVDEIRSGIFRKIDETTSPDPGVAPGRCKFATSTNQDVSVFLKESEKSVYRLLSAEQKETVTKLKGKTFSF